MNVLEKTLRNRLERTIKDARDISEAAARAALEQLGVGEATPFAHLSETERELRRKLRIHGRQLGDTFLPSPSGRGAGGEGRFQTLERLIEEVAYEHWHRMLFARFLAENNLLMYPDPDDAVAVTLEECEDLAADEGAANGWELAARYAARMLPQIFRPDSPVFQIVLPPEHQQKLERLVTDLPLETFTASDSLGWVYQFWQANNKDRINKSEVKIGARELPAVTQLFTEPYMVSFLLDNSLGAWWAARRLSETDLKIASTEEELRNKAAIPGVPLDYLRFVQIPLSPPCTKADLKATSDAQLTDQEITTDQSPPLKKGDEGGFVWAPAAGTFERWPQHLSKLKTLDPCCGSGHFLVAAFLMLVPMRMELEDLTAREAVDRVLGENLHGLELDQRCVELAAFALAFTAWRYPGAGGYRALPELHIACSGLSINAKLEEWLTLADGDINLRLVLEQIYNQFKDAQVLGSLINPEISLGRGSLLELAWKDVYPLLTNALSNEKDREKVEIGIIAQGLSKSAALLSGRYNWVITNVPYLLRRKQSDNLKTYIDRHYPEAKHELSTVFLERCLELANNDGVVQIVMPQNWLFLVQYKAIRRKLLLTHQWKLIARLGAGAFQCISGEVVNITLLTFNCAPPNDNQIAASIDVSLRTDATEKAKGLCLESIIELNQNQLFRNVDSIVVFEALDSSKLLATHVTSLHGLSTTDAAKFTNYFWEVIDRKTIWTFQIGTMKSTADFGGRRFILRWEQGKGTLHALRGKAPIVITGLDAWGKNAVAISQMGELAATLYNGDCFLDGTSVLLPKNKVELQAIYAYCSSNEYRENIRRIDKSIKITYSTLAKVPFDLNYWKKVSEEKYPNGLPKPYSDDPTQWIFHGHPCGSVIWDEEKKWTSNGPSRTDDTILHVAVARLLGYRWPAELDTTMELSDETRAWVKQSETLLSLADKDGIVCIPPVRGEASASDRLFNLLVAAYGDNWSNDTLAQLLKQADHADKTLETWLREKFFTQHCKLFQHRPFIWHIWDGLSDGFAALVNYHKLDAKLLETLIYTYLGDWISRQKQDINNSIDGAQEKLAAAESLKKKLELILEGEAPYDIFVRWKSLSQQSIGWNPDLNDGVRLNIRPFLSVPDVGKRGAGVLRDKPNIKWEKDRGKDVESAPWFHVFNGDRINDHHLTLDDKRRAMNHDD